MTLHVPPSLLAPAAHYRIPSWAVPQEADRMRARLAQLLTRARRGGVPRHSWSVFHPNVRTPTLHPVEQVAVTQRPHLRLVQARETNAFDSTKKDVAALSMCLCIRCASIEIRADDYAVGACLCRGLGHVSVCDQSAQRPDHGAHASRRGLTRRRSRPSRLFLHEGGFFVETDQQYLLIR